VIVPVGDINPPVAVTIPEDDSILIAGVTEEPIVIIPVSPSSAIVFVPVPVVIVPLEFILPTKVIAPFPRFNDLPVITPVDVIVLLPEPIFNEVPIISFALIEPHVSVPEPELRFNELPVIAPVEVIFHIVVDVNEL